MSSTPRRDGSEVVDDIVAALNQHSSPTREPEWDAVSTPDPSGTRRHRTTLGSSTRLPSGAGSPRFQMPVRSAAATGRSTSGGQGGSISFPNSSVLAGDSTSPRAGNSMQQVQDVGGVKSLFSDFGGGETGEWSSRSSPARFARGGSPLSNLHEVSTAHLGS